jgi:hypothetical protein
MSVSYTIRIIHYKTIEGKHIAIITKVGKTLKSMRPYLICTIVGFSLNTLCFAQYAPPAGVQGSTAIKSDSSCIVSWASKCSVIRGHQDISNPTSLNFASVGDSLSATGPNDGNILSLGDGGSAILKFDRPITNGNGFDFAIFENGFDDRYLELAFVEVSSNGIDYFRFPCASLTDTITQVGAFSYWADATLINNLAGKYRGGFGTPFDLQELVGINELNTDSITHVKIIDVVGSLLNEYCSRDAMGRKINDPWPTPFASSGFDLDAIAVIHQLPASVNEKNSNQILVFPTIFNTNVPIKIMGLNSEQEYKIKLLSLNGIEINSLRISHSESALFFSKNLSNGTYLLQITSSDSHQLFKLICVN